MQPHEPLGFHESSVIAILQESSVIIIDLEGVRVGNNVKSASIGAIGIQAIVRDGIEITDLRAESEDGEVLTLEHTDKSLYFIVEWTNFENRKSETHSYRITCDSVTITCNGDSQDHPGGEDL